MTTNGKCFLCGTPLATPEQIDRHICDACSAMAKDNAALGMILLRALYMAADADMRIYSRRPYAIRARCARTNLAQMLTTWRR